MKPLRRWRRVGWTVCFFRPYRTSATGQRARYFRGFEDKRDHPELLAILASEKLPGKIIRMKMEVKQKE